MKYCNHNPSKIWRMSNKSISWKQFIEMYNAEYANLVGDRNYADEFFGKIGVKFNDISDGSNYNSGIIVDADTAMVNQSNNNFYQNQSPINTVNQPNNPGRYDVEIGMPAYEEPTKLIPINVGVIEAHPINNQPIIGNNPAKENPEKEIPSIIEENNKILGGSEKDVVDNLAQITTTNNTVTNKPTNIFKTNKNILLIAAAATILIGAFIYSSKSNKQ